MAACRRYVVTFILLCGFFTVCRSQFELDERFLEYRKHGMWLVEFYAPWCGHCKHLEPIFQDVARELQLLDSPIKVAKMDCTRYTQIASELSVKGFPTIMFIQGNRMFTHRGDRTKDNILEFALRAQGPTLRKLASVGKFNEALSQHSDSVFFLYIGSGDENEDLFKKYSSAAETFAIHSYFYYGQKNIIEDRDIHRHPSVLVFKDKKYYEFEPPDGLVTASALEQFINRERYPSFPKMSGPGLNEMVNVARYLVILAVEAQELNNPSTETSRVYEVVKEVAFGQRVKFHSQFQFLWMNDMDTVNSIAMSFLSTPVIIVMETEAHSYYMVSSMSNLTVTSLIDFLTNVAVGKEQAYGGTGFLMSVRRLLFDLVSLVVSIWQASRWLFILMFGLPTVIISIICYSLCCMEALEDLPDDDEDEEEDDEREKLYDAPPPALTAGQEALPPYDAVGDASSNKDKSEKKND